MTEEPQTLNQQLLAAMDRFAGQSCFQIKKDLVYESVSYRHFHTLVFRLAHFLQRRGVKVGDRIAIFADNSLEWMVAFVAGALTGAIVTPIRTLQPSQGLRHVLVESGACIAIVQDRAQCQLIQALDEELPALETVLVIDEGASTGAGMYPLQTLLEEPLAAADEKALRKHALALPPETLAVMHYTIGPNGNWRGATFDQGQLLQSLTSMAAWLLVDEEDIAFSSPQPWSSQPSLLGALHFFISGVANALTSSDEINF
jgi:long-chain acyl-CoA synthetase